MKKGLTKPLAFCYFKEVGAIAALDKDGRQELEQYSKVRILRHKRGETTEFPIEDSIYILQEGQAFLFCLTPSGRKIILDTLEEGDIFGDLGIQGHLEGGDCLFIEPGHKAVICDVPKILFTKLIKNQPQFATQLILSLNKKLNQLARQVGALLFDSARTKLLLRFAQLAQGGAEKEGWSILPQRITHQQLADMIGVHRETVTLLISELIRNGIVKYQLGHRLSVTKGKLALELTS